MLRFLSFVERSPSISNQRLTNDLLQVSRFHYFLKNEGVLDSQDEW